MTSLPKWMSVGNKLKFKYNVTWECEGTIENIDTSSAVTKLKMKNVTINNTKHDSYTFLTPSIKTPSLIY